MTAETLSDASALLASKIAVPQHVVYRSFPSETVVLNLQTCKYHGLNPTAGQMLETLEHAETARDAAHMLAGLYGEDLTVVEKDVCELCQLLLERGLVEIDGG